MTLMRGGFRIAPLSLSRQSNYVICGVKDCGYVAPPVEGRMRAGLVSRESRMRRCLTCEGLNGSERMFRIGAAATAPNLRLPPSAVRVPSSLRTRPSSSFALPSLTGHLVDAYHNHIGLVVELSFAIYWIINFDSRVYCFMRG